MSRHVNKSEKRKWKCPKGHNMVLLRKREVVESNTIREYVGAYCKRCGQNYVLKDNKLIGNNVDTEE